MAATRRFTDRFLQLLGLRLVVWVIAASMFLPGVLADPPQTIAGYHDEHNCVMHEEAARRTIVEYHQLPAWNPWFCGGIPGIANPPDTSLAPDFLLRVLFGTGPGRRLAVFFLCIMGMEGIFRYARRHDASVVGAAFAGIVFACSGHYVMLLRDGWIFMYVYQLMPWVALSFEAGVRKKGWRIWGGFFMAWIVMCGGTYVAPFTALFLVLLWIIETGRAGLKLDGPGSPRIWAPTLSIATMAAVAIGLTAIRTLPMLSIIVGSPREVDQIDQDAPFTVLSRLFIPHAHGGWGAAAGDFYVGWVTALLALLAIVTVDRKAGRFVFLGVFFMALAAGEMTDVAPYVWLRKLPLYEQLRFPFRYTVVAAMFAALAASRGLTRIEDALPGLLRRIIELTAPEKMRARILASTPSRLMVGLGSGLLALSIAYQGARDVLEHNIVKEGVYYTFDEIVRWDDPDGFRQARGNRWDAHVWPQGSRGSLHCFEENQLFESPYLRSDLKKEEWATDDPDAVVERVRWSPNEIVLHVKSERGVRVGINQNHNLGWQTNVGTVVSDGGVLNVRVPPGEHRVELVFADSRLRRGALVSVVTIMLIGAWCIPRVRRSLRARWRLLRIIRTREEAP